MTVDSRRRGAIVRAEDINHQCLACQSIFAGPAQGQNPGERVMSINAETGESSPSVDDDHPFNVSHGYCASCEQRQREQNRRDVYRHRDEQRVQEELDRRRFRRGRK